MMTLTDKPLNPRQQRILELIEQNHMAGRLPLTSREIATALGTSVGSGITQPLKALEAKGYIHIQQGVARGIELADKGPTPAQQIQALLALIHEAARELERWAADNAADPTFANDLTGMAEGLRAGALEATGAQP